MKDKRLAYLDGLRGVLAMIVFLHHFFYLFHPAFIFGGNAADFLSTGMFSPVKWIALTPLNIFFNPALAIHFFFLLSGYVQTRNYFVDRDVSFLKRSLVKRYLRLAIPVLAVVVFVYVFHRLHWIHKELVPDNSLSGSWKKMLLPDGLNFLEIIKHGLFDSFISASGYYQVLWTMPIELLNSYLILLLLLITHRVNNKFVVLVVLIIGQCYFFSSYYALAFTAGVVIAYSEARHSLFASFIDTKSVRVLCLLTGLYLATYPFTAYQGSLKNSMYGPLAFLEEYRVNISYLLGVILLFCFLLKAEDLKEFLSARVFLFFGKISFMLYLMHLLVLLSFSARLSQWLNANFNGLSSIAINLTLSLAMVTGFSFLLYKLVDKPVLKFGSLFSKKMK